jgi:hypothetical protein
MDLAPCLSVCARHGARSTITQAKLSDVAREHGRPRSYTPTQSIRPRRLHQRVK